MSRSGDFPGERETIAYWESSRQKDGRLITGRGRSWGRTAPFLLRLPKDCVPCLRNGIRSEKQTDGSCGESYAFPIRTAALRVRGPEGSYILYRIAAFLTFCELRYTLLA